MRIAAALLDRRAVVERIKSERAVAVIRTDSLAHALGAANAAVSAGFRVIEITFSFHGASKAIAKLAENDELLVGAGTILTRDHVHEAAEAGARFLVSPCVLPEVIQAAHDLGIAMIPGALTPTEIYTAHSLGADIVKIFPAVNSGPEYLRAVRNPLPDIPIMPTSGVDTSNVADWFRAGAVAVGAVSSVFDPGLMRNGNWAELTKRAGAFLQAVRAAH